MIKLNNKNITYVALADSNNSVKGVKEVWYADSANSVKLVYRRKDALIEGEDYEKYHWLVANTPYGTNIELPLNTANFSFKRIWRDAFNDSLFLSNSEQYVYHAVSKNVHIWDIPNATDIFVGNANRIRNEEIIIYSTDENLTIGDEEVPQLDYPPSIIRFRNADRTNSTQFSTSSIYADGVEHYIPCKLLKPVPKWLDANGIRRQVGECGMIDLVSGKFYGNVNSVGTFTVENYYERKEWLVAEISGVNTLMSLPIYSNKMQYTRVFVKFANIGYFLTTNNISYINISGVNIIYNNLTHTATSCGNSSLLSYIEVVCDSDSIVIDGELLENNLPVEKIQFYNASTTVDANFLTSKVTVDNKERYIPCTLTMDLPASMDANNIARTKGTSGMWDLVSDRFYGNVANSGTFKAVNLAEGVDYEVHQWLKTGSGYPHIQVANEYNTDSGAYIETRYKCNYSNRRFDMIIGFSINQNNNIGIRIFNVDNKTYVDHHKTENGVLSSSRIIKSQSNINAERYIKATLNNLIIDDTEYPTINWDSGFDAMNRRETILYTNQGYNDVHYAETKLRVNNVEYDLIPVKLLKSIPSKYDANGIARQAGECGMYDTVNDVFYGNVASSGTFSVSDDS